MVVSTLSALSIRTRLLLALGLLFAALLVVAGISVKGFQALSRTTHNLVDQQARHAFLAVRTNQHAQNAASHLLRLLLTPDRRQREALYADMDAALNAGDVSLQQLENAQRDHVLAGDAAAVRALRTRYDEEFQATVELIELSGPASAHGHFESTTEPALKALLVAANRLAVAQQDAMQAQVDALTADADATQRRIGIIALLALLVGMVLAGLIVRSIVRPVNEAVQIAERIADGDYSGELPSYGRDEIGIMMRALCAMRKSIGQREAHISKLAYVDALTDLPNRTRFFERFAEMSSPNGALLLIDIDRFSAINAALGHVVGDELLRGVAERLRHELAADDATILARLWGDEFGLLACAADAAQARALAERIRTRLNAPLTIAGQRLDLDVSIGIALFPDDAKTLAQLMSRADAALRAAKRRHAGLAFAECETTAQTPEQLSLIGEMRSALTEQQFVPFYQPKMNLRTRRITGAEALIRWQHPERGLVPPGKFIPFAEQTGFIREITPWLVERVIRDSATWRQAGLELVISANLSTHDLLNADLIEHIIAVLDDSGLPAQALCLEITESALMDEPERALGHLHRLADHGIKLSIDDYGSGQASLAYVKDLPVHELKIDRVFVTDVDTQAKNAAIVRSTTLLCRELGLTIVAEGAESNGELDWLTANGCDLVQGYIIAKPMPGGEFEAFVRRVNDSHGDNNA